MAELITVAGALIAATESEYSFKDRATGRPVEGIARALWVAVSFDQEPVKVKAREDDWQLFEKIAAGGPGSTVALSCNLGARNSTIERTLIGLAEVKPAPK